MRNQSGVTILETVVVIGIVGLVVTLSNFSFQNASRERVMDAAIEQIITDIERVQSNAINGVFPDPTIEPVSWGVQFTSGSPTSYKTFYDLDDYLLNGSDVAETKQLPDNITVTIPGNPVSVTYSYALYNGNFYIDGSLGGNNQTLLVSDASTGNSQIVSINTKGLVIVAPACGDGQKQAGEECDDGNVTSNDACSFDCKIEWCGDGIWQDQVKITNSNGVVVRANLLEQCDRNAVGSEINWNTASDRCNSVCQIVPQGSGGGGCSVIPYNPSNPHGGNSSSAFAWLLLLPAPFLVWEYRKRLAKVYAKR